MQTKKQITEPTVVIFMDGGKVTSVIGSQNLRVIVLEEHVHGAGAGAAEPDSPLMSAGVDQFTVTDVRVCGSVSKSPAGVRGVDANYCASVAGAVEGKALPLCDAESATKGFSGALPVLASVSAKAWDMYEYPDAPMTHQIDLDDQRLSNGQVFLTVGAIEGDLDDLISVTAEVSTNPITGVEHVPCVHVHFDEDGMAFSLYKLNNKILMRPETGVKVDSFVKKVGGMNELFYMIE